MKMVVSTTQVQTGGDRPSESAKVIAPRLVTDLLDQAVARFGERPAIDFLGRRWRYRELGKLVERAAAGLQARGVVAGTRVGLCLPNSPYFVILYFAVLRAGGIVVNYNPLYVERELEHQVRDSGTSVMATCDIADIHARVAAVAARTGIATVILCPVAAALPPLKGLFYRIAKRRETAAMPRDARHVSFAALIAGRRAPTPVARSPGDVAVLQYTGGTTGVPKAAMLTHANLAANSAQMEMHVAATARPRPAQIRTLGVLPLFHVFALTTVLNHSVECGAEMVLLPRFDMPSFLAAVRRTRPTQFYGVPTLYAALAQLPEGDRTALASLELSISGGAPLPAEVRHAFEANTGCRVVEGYGLTEAAPIIACSPLKQGVVKDGSCGPAFPATTIEVRALGDPTRLAAPGERGEVCARGPQVMAGYWGRAEATAEVMIDGALRTGDVGYLDEDGYLFLVDRIKDVILCGGYNVYPRVIEEALYEHEAVAEAVVIGVPDAYRGQSAKAFVSLHPGAVATAEELLRFLEPRLNRIEMPRAIDIRDELPKTAVGKLSKKELADQEAAAAATMGAAA